ncbi:hypothetical protein AB5I41_20995 [Sphingomonas sp. MMS24-JH45]
MDETSPAPCRPILRVPFPLACYARRSRTSSITNMLIGAALDMLVGAVLNL